jgi:hypothetical protein
MGFIADAIEDVANFVGDTVEKIIDNPVGALVSVGSMALGVPPVWAGALGGAANAAVNDQNILEGALTGGAMGYVGGLAGQAAAGAGAGNILAGAAGGAAAGATGAALTGQDILKGALGGGAMGGLGGAAYDYILKPDGSLAPVEDRSTWSSDAIREQNAQGNTVKISHGDGTSSFYTPDGALTTLNADGSIWSQDLDGNVTIRSSDGGIYKQNADGTQTFTGKVYTYDDGSTLTVDPEGNPVSNTPATDNPNPALPGGPTVGGDQPAQPPGTVTPPITPTFPVIPPNTTPKPASTDTGAGNYNFVHSEIRPGQGLNPGWIAPTPFYHTNDPAQSQFYWGSHGFQAGPTFNAQAFNQAPAPMTPWGAQDVAEPLTPEQTRAAYTGTYTPIATATPATRVQPYNPQVMMQPSQDQISGQIYLVPIAYGGQSQPTPAVTAPVAPVPA